MADIHDPFTASEHIQKLCDIDQSLTDLLTHVSSALAALSPSSSDSATVGTEPQQQAFCDATDAFLDCLHSVDVRMKRLIWALEEAGIIRLRDSHDATVAEDDSQAHVTASSRSRLQPDGVGALGSLDVGWLSSRSSRVARDMEAELWEKARVMLQERFEANDVVANEPPMEVNI